MNERTKKLIHLFYHRHNHHQYRLLLFKYVKIIYRRRENTKEGKEIYSVLDATSYGIIIDSRPSHLFIHTFIQTFVRWFIGPGRRSRLDRRRVSFSFFELSYVRGELEATFHPVHPVTGLLSWSYPFHHPWPYPCRCFGCRSVPPCCYYHHH